MKTFKINFCISLLCLVVFSPTTQSSSFITQSYIGVINIHQIQSSAFDNNKVTRAGKYFLHTFEQTTPLTLVFKNGQPDSPVMTGDKVEVVGISAAGKFYVQQIESIPNNSLPF